MYSISMGYIIMPPHTHKDKTTPCCLARSACPPYPYEQHCTPFDMLLKSRLYCGGRDNQVEIVIQYLLPTSTLFILVLEKATVPTNFEHQECSPCHRYGRHGHLGLQGSKRRTRSQQLSKRLSQRQRQRKVRGGE
jgi:hypothetical protein